MGTPNYMAPEQKEHPDAVDHRADIYALGVVFYQMLTGELPGKKIEPPSAKVQIDVRLDEVVLRALEKKPELRYQQASELKTQVETIATTPGDAAETPVGKFDRAQARPEWVAVDRWLALMDQGDYTRSWETASARFQQAISKDEWIERLRSARQPQGMVVSRRLRTARRFFSRYTVKFNTAFAGLKAAVETVTFSRERDGQWRAIGYLILPAYAEESRLRKQAWEGLFFAGLSGVAGIAAFCFWPNPPGNLIWGIPVAALLGIIFGIPAREHRLGRRAIAIGGVNLAIWLAIAIAVQFVRPSAPPTLQVTTPDAYSSPKVEHTLANPPFVAQLPDGGSIELLAVRIQSLTNGPWWQLDGSPSVYDSSIEPENKEQLRGGILALARLDGPTPYQKWPLPAGRKNPALIDFADGLSFAAEHGRRLLTMESDTHPGRMFGIMSFPLFGGNETTLAVRVAVADWQTLTVQKPGWLASLFTSGARKEWKFSETPEGDLKLIITHIAENAEMEYRLVAVDLDGTEYTPNQTQRTKRADEMSATLEATFAPPDGSRDRWQLPLSRVREVRLEARPYERVEFRQVSLQPGHQTMVTVKDFGSRRAVEPTMNRRPEFSAEFHHSFAPRLWLDLMTGKTARLPQSVSSSDNPNGLDYARVAVWAKSEGVQLAMDADTNNPSGLLGIGAKIIRLERDDFRDLTAAQLLDELRHNEGLPGVPATAQSSDKRCVRFGSYDLPVVFGFQTDQGLQGILEITGYSTSPRRVNISYKLVQSGGAAAEGDLTLAEQPPVVVETFPVSGTRDVLPGETEIRVRFSKPMTDGSWSWSTAWENSTPESIGDPHFLADERTCVMKVRLEPGRTYAWWLNSDKFKNFSDQAGQPAVPYLLIFQTKPN